MGGCKITRASASSDQYGFGEVRQVPITIVAIKRHVEADVSRFIEGVQKPFSAAVKLWAGLSIPGLSCQQQKCFSGEHSSDQKAKAGCQMNFHNTVYRLIRVAEIELTQESSSIIETNSESPRS